MAIIIYLIFLLILPSDFKRIVFNHKISFF